MTRFLFEFEIRSTGKKGEFSWIAQTEEEAREQVHAKIADFEFVEKADVIVGKLIATKDPKNNQHYECEGCSA